MTREGSGTSWLPDSTPDEGVHVMAEDWMLMAHGLFNGVYDKQGGPRGGEKAFASGMLMGMAERQIGDGTLGSRQCFRLTRSWAAAAIRYCWRPERRPTG